MPLDAVHDSGTLAAVGVPAVSPLGCPGRVSIVSVPLADHAEVPDSFFARTCTSTDEPNVSPVSVAMGAMFWLRVRAVHAPAFTRYCTSKSVTR